MVRSSAIDFHPSGQSGERRTSGCAHSSQSTLQHAPPSRIHSVQCCTMRPSAADICSVFRQRQLVARKAAAGEEAAAGSRRTSPRTSAPASPVAHSPTRRYTILLLTGSSIHVLYSRPVGCIHVATGPTGGRGIGPIFSWLSGLHGVQL